MENIDKEITAYKSMQQNLESEHMRKWVLIKDEKLVAVFDSFDLAAQEAVKQFGQGPYLIRQVGVTSATLPISVMYSI